MLTNYIITIIILVINILLTSILYLFSFKTKNTNKLFKRINKLAFITFSFITLNTLLLLVSSTFSKIEILDKIVMFPGSHYDGSSSSRMHAASKVWYFKTRATKKAVIKFYKKRATLKKWIAWEVKPSGLVIKKNSSHILYITAFKDKNHINYIQYKILNGDCVNDNDIGLKPYMMGPHELLNWPKELFCKDSKVRKNGVNLYDYMSKSI